MPSLKRWMFRLACAGIIAAAAGYIPYRVYGSEGYVHYRTLQQDLRGLERDNAALRAENERLARDIERLSGDDLDAIARVARDELGLVLPGEMVLQIERDRVEPKR